MKTPALTAVESAVDKRIDRLFETHQPPLFTADEKFFNNDVRTTFHIIVEDMEKTRAWRERIYFFLGYTLVLIIAAFCGLIRLMLQN